MNTPVKFELAKLLKKKGFNKKCIHLYFDGELKELIVEKVSYDDTLSSRYYIAPTIAEVVMWLYEKHRIWISITVLPSSQDKSELWGYILYNINKTELFANVELYEKERNCSALNSPTEAYESAIEYALNNLIK